MKNIGLLFSIAFLMFLMGQLLWTTGLIFGQPLFGSQNIDDWIINIPFTLCAIFGLIGSIRLYQNKNLH